MKNTLLVASLLTLATTTAGAEVKKGDHFVELDAQAMNGKKFHLKDMAGKWVLFMGSSRVDLQACKLEYSIVSPK